MLEAKRECNKVVPAKVNAFERKLLSERIAFFIPSLLSFLLARNSDFLSPFPLLLCEATSKPHFLGKKSNFSPSSSCLEDFLYPSRLFSLFPLWDKSDFVIAPFWLVRTLFFFHTSSLLLVWGNTQLRHFLLLGWKINSLTSPSLLLEVSNKLKLSHPFSY